MGVSKKNEFRTDAELVYCFGFEILKQPVDVKFGYHQHVSRLMTWKWVGAVLGGVSLAKTSSPIPDALADAMVRYPEEAEAYKAEMDMRRQIAGLKFVSGW